MSDPIELSASAHRLLSRLADATRTLEAPREIVIAAMRVLREHLGADRCAWAEVEEDEACFTFLGADVAPGVPGVEGRHPPSAFDAEALAALRSGRPFIRIDALADRPVRAEHAAYGASDIQALAAVPVHERGRLVGIVGVHALSPRAFTPEELQLAHELARRGWESIQQARAHAALRARAARLEEAERRKDDLLATLAHELRNPLAPIRNAVQILLGTASTEPSSRAACEMIDRQVRHMMRLMDDLVDVARATGELTLRRQRVELATIVAQALELSRPPLERAGLSLVASLPPEPILLDADPVRLSQVLWHLLDDAATHTGTGGEVRITAERDGTHVQLAVEPEPLPHVLDGLARVSSASDRSGRGPGIGLSLARELVELHGGTLTARSEGRGARFEVRLPVSAEPLVDETHHPAPAGPARASVRVLVVDDNRDGADSLAQLLELGGAQVSVAYDGLQAVAVAQRERPDLVLLDIGMPVLDGYEACRRIRAAPWGATMMVIAQTGWGTAEDRQRTRDAGFDGHLVKPVDPERLMRLMDELSAMRRRR